MFGPGDILLYTAPTLKLSNLIAKGVGLVEGNKVHHVAIYLGADDKRHTILEALSDGVKIKTLDDNCIYTRTDGKAMGFTLYGFSKLPKIQVSVGNNVFAFSAAKYDGSSYGYLTNINILLQHGKCRLFPKKPWTIWFKSKKGLICSEVAQLVIKDVLDLYKMDLPFKKEAALTEPDDYLYAPWEVTIINNN